MQKVLLLLSGGFDSPVAGRMLRERGFRVGAVHFQNELAGHAVVGKARKLAAMLGFKPFFLVNITKNLQAIAGKCDPKYYFVLQKRLMLQKAGKLAQRNSFAFLATGESLAQVSSQTARNLSAIDQAALLPVLRPLIGFNKEEIIRLAKEIGTYETSCGPEFCDMFGPKEPATQARLHIVLEEEAKLNECKTNKCKDLKM
ncbi:hypothetical protein HY546_03125 [archaeon]|nr:hypothetical protein [archaeon]